MLEKMRSKSHDKSIRRGIGWCTNEDTGFWLGVEDLKYSLNDGSVMTTSAWLKVNKIFIGNLVFPVPGGPLIRCGTGDW